MLAVTPARKPIVEITPSFRPKITSRMSRPCGVCHASLWKRLSGSARRATGVDTGPRWGCGGDAIL